jgi:hypothetical protein
MTTSDPELDRVRRAFDRTFARMSAATTDDDVEDELTCALHHLYRLSELCWKRLRYTDRGKFYEWLHQSSDRDLRAAAAATWARNFDTHGLVVMATPIDTYGDIYGDVYGASRWNTRPVQADKKYKRHKDYEDFLEGRDIAPTLRSAFDAMVALVP